MADPGFAQKLVLESCFASGASLWYEYRLRGDKFKEEADLALINTLGMAAATAATVWLLAPCRSYGSIQKFPWQQVRGKSYLIGGATRWIKHTTVTCACPQPCAAADADAGRASQLRV